MKPTSPEQKEIDELGADVSAAYRAMADAEPPARVDAAILEAARREAGRPRRASWQLPAAVAAVLVLGVSLTLRMWDEFGGLPPPESVGRKQAELAKPAAPSLDLQASDSTGSDAAKPKADLQARPTRERTGRDDHEAEARVAPEAMKAAPAGPDPAPASSLPDSPAAAPPASEPARQAYAPAASGPAPAPVPRALEESQSSDAAADAAEKKSETAEAMQGRRNLALRKEAPSAAGAVAQRSAQDWLQEIDSLLRDGKNDQARARFAEFRRYYPDQAVPDGLKELARDYDADR